MVMRTVIVLVAAFVLLVLWGWIFSWKKLPYYTGYGDIKLPEPIMSWGEYEKIIDKHPRPYIVDIRNSNGGVVLYGATHTKNADDPQIADIERRWDEFKPTVALCESRLGILFPGIMNPLKEFSEPGFVHQLARRDGIPTYTWEPTPQAEMDYLLSLSFSKEQIALRVKLGPYFSNLRNGKPTDPNDYVEDYLHDNERWPGLENTLTTVAEIDSAWVRYFPDGPDWRDVSDQYGLPGYLNSVPINEARDEHLVRIIIDLVRKGERVFAVAGLSHAVRLEPVLKSALAKQ